MPEHRGPVLELLEVHDPLQRDGIRVVRLDHDAAAVSLSVVVVVVIDGLQQGDLGEKLADGGRLSGVVWNALYA
jgi:hypothetical protein